MELAIEVADGAPGAGQGGDGVTRLEKMTLLK